MDMNKAIATAQAVNSLLHLSSEDQQSLLGIIEDYFTCSQDDLEPEGKL